MRKLLVAVLLSTGLCPPAAGFDLFRPDLWFAPSDCVVQIPDISVSSRESEVLIDHSMPHERIDGIARDLRGAVMSGWRTNGLAAAQLRSEGDTFMSIQELSDGSWCGSLEGGRFDIGYDDPMRIYVTSQYAPGSCPYEAIVQHELQHVDIYRSVLSAHLGDADRRIATIVFGNGPVRGATKGDVAAGIDAIVERAVSEVVDEIAAESRQRNGVLDTVDNYMRVQSACPQW